MHTISPNDKVLVSGANGFIAMWVVRSLLDKGYAVRGTVRTADKGKYLEEYFKAYGNKFETIIVEDITKEGAFDKAVKGVHAIAHTASPFYFDAATVDELLGPAVDGTLGILKSALKYGQGIKRVILTSSTLAVSGFTACKPMNEDDWNEPSIREIEKSGDDSPGLLKYSASKTAAEKGKSAFYILFERDVIIMFSLAAWKFYKEHKTVISWDFSVLNPPYVFGPPITKPKSSEALNTSLQIWYDAVVVGGQTEDFSKTGLAFIDVRDLAQAHVLALEKEAAGDERIIVSAGPFIWQQWLNAANSFSPSPIPSHPRLPVGYPGLVYTAKPSAEFDTGKAARILSLTYLNLEQVSWDSLTDFEKRGW